MVGGGSRRDDVPVINSTNVFAALGSLKKKKKKPEKDQGPSDPNKAHDSDKKDLFWAPAPLTSKSWADVDDEDDDDYYATTAPPESVWAAPPASETVSQNDAAAEESESEIEGLDDADDDAEDEHENDIEVPEEAEPVLSKPPEPSLATKETERQLSKKELKKKGLEELEAVLAELGYAPKEQDDSHGVEKKEEDPNGAVEKKENATGESKNAKKKKKKDKSSKEQKESQDQADVVVDAGNTTSETTAEMEKAEDASAIDVKERLKKVASMKKKKSSKEMDTAARAAANEAAARSAKLAAAKKKEKAHYNQQPVR